jgi:hypothetical protein
VEKLLAHLGLDREEELEAAIVVKAAADVKEGEHGAVVVGWPAALEEDGFEGSDLP